MFTPGFWIHKDAMDIFLEVQEVMHNGKSRSKLKVRYWSKGAVNEPWLVSTETDNIMILVENYKDWVRYE